MPDKTAEELQAESDAATAKQRQADEAKQIAVVDEPPADTAATRLRAFEDKHFGKKAVRIDGRIERGYGSPFKAMIPEKQAEYAAIEKLVEAEQKVIAANAALSAAQAEHDIAQNGADVAEAAADKAADEAEQADAEAKSDAVAQ